MKVPSGFSYLFLAENLFFFLSKVFSRTQAYKIESAGVHHALPKHNNDDDSNNRIS